MAYAKKPASGDPFLEKGLPCNPEAEASILGGIILDNNLCDDVMALMVVDDFFFHSNRYIFNAMVALWEKGQSIDMVTISEELRRAGLFEAAGGATYIASLIDGVPRTDTAEPYMKIVKGKATLRKLITAAANISAMAFDEEFTPDEITDKAEGLIYKIAESRIVTGFRPVAEIAQMRLLEVEALTGRPELLTGVPTGFTDFDQLTAGLQKQDLITIAARPSMGKTALALNMGLFAAKAGYGVGVFSLEMSAGQLVSRLLASEARVDAQRLRTGYLNQNEWDRLATALQRLCEIKIEIDDTPGISIPEMRAKARRLKTKMQKEGRDLDLLIVDYMQLMSGTGKVENRQQEVSQISRDLKTLAKELNIPVISLSQLSRATETRSDHKPQLSDLRETGSIEQDSDVVAFIYRDEVYYPSDENRGVAELIVAKQRNGPTGSLPLAFLKEFTRFENMWKAETDMPVRRLRAVQPLPDYTQDPDETEPEYDKPINF